MSEVRPSTKLPWKLDVDDDTETAFTSVISECDRVDTVLHQWHGPFKDRSELTQKEVEKLRTDYAYIVHAANTLPALEQRVRELEVLLRSSQAFIAVMFGQGSNCAIPETIDSPIGVPIRIAQLLRDIDAALLEPKP